MRSIAFIVCAFCVLGPSRPSPSSPPSDPVLRQGEDGKEKKGDEGEESLATKVREHMDRICLAKDASFDGKALTAKYREPMNFADDVEGRTHLDPDHVDFRLHRFAETGCFSGNTAGMLLLRPHFKGRVKVEATVYFQIVERNTVFLMLVNAGDGKFLANNLGVHLLQKKSKNKRPKFFPCHVKSYAGDPSKWVDRTSSLRLTLIYDPAKKRLETRLNGSLITTAKIDGGPESGQIGFQWSRCKFTVVKLDIDADLDLDWTKKAVNEERPPEKD